MTAIYGTARYSRFILRRERVSTPAWVIGLSGMCAAIGMVFINLFPTVPDMLAMAETMATPAMAAVVGPVYGVEAITSAILYAQEMLLFLAIVVGVMNIFLVNRHTRGDEELGRLEMFRALPCGRLTNPAATLAFAFRADAATGLLIALGVMASGLPGVSAAGAFVFGGIVGAVGFLFAAVTLLGAQLYSTARGALTFSFVIMGVLCGVRAIGDMGGGSVLSVISPLGLCVKVSAFYENNAYPILIVLLEALALGAIALAVCARRDLGEGVVPARKGRKNASRFLQTPLGFAWRLSRSNFYAWIAGLFAMGLVYGAVTGRIEDFIGQNEMFKTLILSGGGAGTIAQSFMAVMFIIMALLGSIPVISTAMRIQTEEKRGRLESIFSRAVSRPHLLGAYIVIAAAESAAMMFVCAVGMYIAAASTGLLAFGTVVKAAMLYVPAIWAMMGLGVLLVGWLPKLKGLVWAVFGYSLFALYFGRLFNLPAWCGKLTPFGHIPQIPLEKFSALPLIILTAIAAALTALGVWAFAKRDIG